MGMEVAGTELPKVNGDVKTKENGKIDFSEEITFGSHGVDEQVKGESTKVSNANVQQGAADEWGETKVHYYWFIRHRSFEDPSLRAKIDQADKDIQKKQQQINQLYDEMKLKKTKRHELIQEKKALNAENDQYREFINEKREEMKPLQTALGSLRGGGGGGGEKGYVCSTEEELNQRIRSLEYQMQHESLSLKEEKQLLREIKELEATRPKVVANTAARAKIQESLGEKEAIQDQVKLLGTDLDGVRKQQAVVKAKRERLNPLIDALAAEIDALDKEINNAKGKREEAYNTVKQIRKLINEKNAHLDEYRNNLNVAKEISFQKDVKALEELNRSEVEKFFSQWNSSKAFRDDYAKRGLRFNAGRLLCKDGRMMNDNEKPMKEEPPKPSEPDVASKATPKPQKEAVKPTSKVETLPLVQVSKDLKKGKKELKSTSEQEVEEEEVFVVGKPKKDASKDKEIDAEKLKEMKKEEEKEKNKQALERKKKMQEKAAAKAVARAQKEAEKKQKEREKKLRKKEGSTLPPNNEEEPADNLVTDEPENPDEVEEAEIPVPSKAKGHPNSLKNRKPVKSRGAPPKAILKKKKSDKYLLYGSMAAAALGVLLLLVIGYKYFV